MLVNSLDRLIYFILNNLLSRYAFWTQALKLIEVY